MACSRRCLVNYFRPRSRTRQFRRDQICHLKIDAVGFDHSDDLTRLKLSGAQHADKFFFLYRRAFVLRRHGSYTKKDE